MFANRTQLDKPSPFPNTRFSFRFMGGTSDAESIKRGFANPMPFRFELVDVSKLHHACWLSSSFARCHSGGPANTPTPHAGGVNCTSRHAMYRASACGELESTRDV